MKNLTSLVERFSKILNKKEIAKEVVTQAVSKYTNINIPKEKIFIKESILEIHGTPALNNEIRLKEDKILREIREVSKIYIQRVLYK